MEVGVWVPGEFAEAVEVGEGHRVVHPVGVEADVGDGDEAAGTGLVVGERKAVAGDDVFDRAGLTVYTEIGIEYAFPHAGKPDHVALLAGVLLGGLDLNGDVAVRKVGEEGAYGLAGLEVDGAFLDLDDDIGFELAVVTNEVVDTGAGAIGFGIVPVEVIVVDEAAIEDDAVVRCQGAG